VVRPSLRTMRRSVVVVMVALVAAACSSGPAAPAPEPTTQVCTDAFCMDVPVGWSGEATDSFIAFHHDVLPDGTFLTANTVDMEAIVTAAGGTWPATTEQVVEAFWQLLEDVGEGEVTGIQRMVGGAYRSNGTHSSRCPGRWASVSSCADRTHPGRPMPMRSSRR
jgi:hypothetical protein